jgi:hypothetical protein
MKIPSLISKFDQKESFPLFHKRIIGKLFVSKRKELVIMKNDDKRVSERTSKNQGP